MTHPLNRQISIIEIASAMESPVDHCESVSDMSSTPEAVSELLIAMRDHCTMQLKGSYSNYVEFRRQIEHRLRLEILGGCFRPGSSFRIEAMASRFNAESAIIKEVLETLCQDGLIELQRGYWSLPTFRESDFCRAFHFRVWTEVLAARTLATQAGDMRDRVIQHLYCLVGEIADCVSLLKDDPDDYHAAATFALRDLDFHLLITDSVQHGIGTHAVRQAFHFINLSICSAKKRPRQTAVIQEHEVIVEAIESGKPHLVNAAYRSHFEGASYQCRAEVQKRVLANMDEELRRLDDHVSLREYETM